MHLPRRHYRDIARALTEDPNQDTAAAAVGAINDLLEERARLSLKIVNQSTKPKPKPKVEPCTSTTPKSRRSLMEILAGWRSMSDSE